MNDGILTLAFGEVYDNMAAKCFAHSRKYTDLPIQVLTNLKTRSPIWDTIPNVTFSFFDDVLDSNRAYKTQMYKYTEFDRTLYVDCDAILQNHGIETYFGMIPEDGLLLTIFETFQNKSQVYSLYKDAYLKAGIIPPITIYFGACIGFTKNSETFFNLWNEHWKLNGSGREMPALSCAVRLSGINKVELDRNKLLAWEPPNRSAIIQHDYYGCVANLVGYKAFKAHRPFDKEGQWEKNWKD